MQLAALTKDQRNTTGFTEKMKFEFAPSSIGIIKCNRLSAFSNYLDVIFAANKPRHNTTKSIPKYMPTEK